MILLTEKQRAREVKHLKIAREFMELSRDSRNSKTAIIDFLRVKYGVRSVLTIRTAIEKYGRDY